MSAEVPPTSRVMRFETPAERPVHQADADLARVRRAGARVADAAGGTEDEGNKDDDAATPTAHLRHALCGRFGVGPHTFSRTPRTADTAPE